MINRLETAFDQMAMLSMKQQNASSELCEAFSQKYGIEYTIFCEEHSRGDEFVEAYDYASGPTFSIQEIDEMVEKFKASKNESENNS